MSECNYPTDPMEIRRLAADLLERNGLHKGSFLFRPTYETPVADCKACMVGACKIVAGAYSDDPECRVAGADAGWAAAESTGLMWPPGFNDDPATTVADVVRVLREGMTPEELKRWNGE